MCNFVPGQAVAIGPYQSLKNLGDGLPGQLGPVLPLVGELPGPAFPTRLMDLGIVTLRTEPGLELHAVSQLSARLAGAIQSKAAVADVNAILPTAASTPPGNDPLRLSPYAENEADAIRRHLRAALGRIAPPTRIAVLDSGLSENYSAHRDMRYLDYSNGGRLLRDTVPSDPMGHGTRVVSILDRILPVQVGLSVGRLPGTPAGLTALAVCQALGDIVAREHPDVVNLSVAPRSDSFICPHCRQRVPAPTFLSSLLPLVIRLAGESTHGTITVMAAGNSGQPPNSRWLTEDVSTLLFAVAQNRRHERARYSGAPEGPLGDLCTVAAFGGDDPDEADPQGVFTDGAHGTSFAAPFVAATALLAKFIPFEIAGPAMQIGLETQRVIDAARGGVPPHVVPQVIPSAAAPQPFPTAAASPLIRTRGTAGQGPA